MHKHSTRIGANWLVLTPMSEHTWRLQVWGDAQLEAEVTAANEVEAKNSAISATLEKLNITSVWPLPTWNIAVSTRWDSREDGDWCDRRD